VFRASPASGFPHDDLCLPLSRQEREFHAQRVRPDSADMV